MTDFILPDIGEGIVECELLKWLVAEGDTVLEDQAIAEVMTDKATVEIPAMHNGVVSKLYYQEGDIAKVHAPLFAMQNNTTDENRPVLESTSVFEQSKQSVNTNNDSQQIEAFILPDIGEGIVECEIMQWHVSDGDEVHEDQVVVEVMTDKAIVEIPAKYNGRILKLHYKKGEIAGVHTPLFDQAIGNEQLSDQPQSKKDIASQKASDVTIENNETACSSRLKQGENFVPEHDIDRPIASPAVRRLAKEHGVRLSDVTPSGAKGRVLKHDIIHALSVPLASTIEKPRVYKPGNEAMISSNEDKVEFIKGVRAAMGKQMMASVSSIPHFSVTDELPMDKLIELRNRLKPVFSDASEKLSFMPFFIKALSLTMQSFPILNSRLNDDGTKLTYLSAHNIGLAVDSKIGLLVPNIKNVQSLSLFDIAQQLNDIIERARLGKLTKAELANGTISISNVGAIGGITATPIINKPEVAIVALGKMQTLPRFNEAGEVYSSNVMMLNWSGDHRVIDGATMVKFNNMWMDYLCHPERMLVHLR
jgi:2-oxoisovalerate dehydrogenase E2 component (dihydrolipoyl transacylase)